MSDEDKLKEALQALEDVVDPIAALRRFAAAQDRQLDGHLAVQLAKDPGYLKGIAKAALIKIRA